MVSLKKYIQILIRVLKLRTKQFFNEDASPLVEEGLLIGLAIIIFLVIAAILTDVVDWVNNLAGNLPS